MQIRGHLESLGYRINTRMVRTRITQRNFQKNNQMRDMVAALRLLNPCPALWPSPEPIFLTRGRQVTIHGRFGDRMQEGLAHMVRRGPDVFPYFRQIFDLVRPLLSECYPMGLAQFLAVVCEVVTCAAPPFDVLKSLVRYPAAMASSLPVQESVKSFLRILAISSLHKLLLYVVSSLIAALAVFSELCRNTRRIGVDVTLFSQSLQNMRDCVDDALNEALIWFEPTSRRITRIKEQRSHVRALLEVMGYQEPVVLSSPDKNCATFWSSYTVTTRSNGVFHARTLC